MSRLGELCQILSEKADLTDYYSGLGFADINGSFIISEDIQDRYVEEMNQFYELINEIEIDDNFCRVDLLSGIIVKYKFIERIGV